MTLSIEYQTKLDLPLVKKDTIEWVDDQMWLVPSPRYPEIGGSNHGAGKNELLEIMIFYHLEISTKPAVGSFQYCQPARISNSVP